MTTRTYTTVQFPDRRIAHAEWTDGPPRIDVSAPDALRIGWLGTGGRWLERQLQPGEELVVEHVSRKLYSLSILLPADDGGRVEYKSDTRPRPTRIRGSRWWRVHLTDSIYGRRHVAYLRDVDGIVIG